MLLIEERVAQIQPGLTLCTKSSEHTFVHTFVPKLRRQKDDSAARCTREEDRVVFLSSELGHKGVLCDLQCKGVLYACLCTTPVQLNYYERQ